MIIRVNEVIIIRIDGASDRIVNTRSILIGVETDPESLLYVIDMVVSSVLMSMGMMMLPPTTISLPFKILLFVLADGWDLVIKSLVQTFY